jgi:hypothetical protein
MTSSSTLKMVCNKDQVSLYKDVINFADKTYKIIFNTRNDAFPISTMIGFKMYTLLYELNRDIIHSFKVIKENDKSIEMVFLFKTIGKEFGLAPKFMHTITTADCIPQQPTNSCCISSCIFNSVDVSSNEKTDDNISIPKKYERLHTNNSALTVQFISNHELHYNFTFSLKDNDNDSNGNNQSEKNEAPIYMENSVALMIKKMFCRLKVFTERMT